MNNNFLGMVRQWQEFFFEKRYSAVNMRTPDFVKIAEAHGIPARLVTKPEEVQDAITWARNTPGPVLLEFRVEQEEAVYPMVPAGAALDQMLRRPQRDLTPALRPCTKRRGASVGQIPYQGAGGIGLRRNHMQLHLSHLSKINLAC
jgi:hypothetical protein